MDESNNNDVYVSLSIPRVDKAIAFHLIMKLMADLPMATSVSVNYSDPIEDFEDPDRFDESKAGVFTLVQLGENVEEDD